tara:strand:- start:2730 stop:2993 length:264 start_codon:yes stop_codon:yes gene_type:complete
MWTLSYVKEQIGIKQIQIQDKDAFIREADYDRDLSECVAKRHALDIQLVKLEVIYLEMQKCEAMTDMELLIAQKKSVYNLIREYKGE